MLEKFTDLRADLLPEEGFLLVEWRKRVHSRREVVGVLLLHEMAVLLFKLIDH